MTFFRELALGFRAYIEAHRFIRKHKLWGYLLLPGLINLILFVLTFWLAWHYSAVFTDWFFELINFTETDSKGMGILKTAINFLVLFVLRVGILLLYVTTYKYLVLILMAPIMAYLSEKTEELLTGKRFPFSWWQFVKDVFRGIAIALRNLVIEIVLTVLFLLLGTVPVIGMAGPVMIFIVQTYFYGFSMMDYYNERHRIPVGRSARFIYRHKGVAIANGATFYGILTIPLIGWIFAPVYGVVAGAIATHKVTNSEQAV